MQLTDSQFKKVTEIAYKRWGLSISQEKRAMINGRLQKALRRSRFSDLSDYISHIDSAANEEELLELFDVLSTNFTSFFRDPMHFQYLERELYTALARGNITLPNKKIRIWSAACSTGMEPYSLAISARETLPANQGWDFKILATDLSNTALGVAKRGVYEADGVSGVSPELLRKYFLRGKGGMHGKLRVCKEISSMISFGRLNLMEPWPMKGPMHAIFCRNVMIYFDLETRKKLVMRMIDLLAPGGLLFVGSSETLHGLGLPLTTVQANIYRRQ